MKLHMEVINMADYKVKRKHYIINGSPEAPSKPKESMQESLDRLGYPNEEPQPGNANYVSWLGW